MDCLGFVVRVFLLVLPFSGGGFICLCFSGVTRPNNKCLFFTIQ